MRLANDMESKREGRETTCQLATTWDLTVGGACLPSHFLNYDDLHYAAGFMLHLFSFASQISQMAGRVLRIMPAVSCIERKTAN